MVLFICCFKAISSAKFHILFFQFKGQVITHMKAGIVGNICRPKDAIPLFWQAWYHIKNKCQIVIKALHEEIFCLLKRNFYFRYFLPSSHFLSCFQQIHICNGIQIFMFHHVFFYLVLRSPWCVWSDSAVIMCSLLWRIFWLTTYLKISNELSSIFFEDFNGGGLTEVPNADGRRFMQLCFLNTQSHTFTTSESPHVFDIVW